MVDIHDSAKKLAEMYRDKFRSDETGAVWIPNTNFGYWPEATVEDVITQDSIDALLAEIGIRVYVYPVFRPDIKELQLIIHFERTRVTFFYEDSGEIDKLPATCVAFNRAIELLEREGK